MIITGASRGIGAATARLAAQQGYAVCVNYRAARGQALIWVSSPAYRPTRMGVSIRLSPALVVMTTSMT